MNHILLLLALSFSYSCRQESLLANKSEKDCALLRTENSSFSIKNKYLRKKRYFTQGLLFDGPTLLESSGSYGNSYLHKLKLDEASKTVEVDGKSVKLGDQYFGEGSDILEDSKGTKHIYQLTWKSKKIFKYNMNFQKVAEHELPSEIITGQGWGLTHDPKRPTIGIMSDGSEFLYEIDAADNLKVIKKIKVVLNEKPIKYLNELEWIKGEIWSNIFTKDYIVRIDPKSGEIIQHYNMEDLVDEARCDLKSKFGLNFDSNTVLNGIAYNEENGKIYVTGKLWAFIYEVEFGDF